MSTSQRVSQGFHRLGLFLASIILLIGGFAAMFLGPNWSAPFPEKLTLGLLTPQPRPDLFNPVGVSYGYGSKRKIVEIEGIGKVKMPKHYVWQTEAKQQELMNWFITENWRKKFAQPLVQPLLIAFALAFAVYGIVRAIGWVIGGFMAS
jgi:hypothetical protein